MTNDPTSDPALLLPTTSRLRRSRRLWRVLTFVALAVAVLALAARFGLPDAGVGDRIARVEIDGTIATNAGRLAALEEIGELASVKAVIVAINSPGGTTAGGEELYEALMVLREKKPVVAVIKEVGASAAYMTAIATDRIFSRRLSIVASIGVLFQTVNAGKLMQTIGVDLEKVQTGPLKAEPDIDEPMTPEVRASIQSLVNDSFDWFVDIVAERRGLDRPAVLTLADGRIITGRQGVEARLIDDIGGEAEAIAWLESEREILADLPVITYYPLPEPGFGNIWDMILGSALGALGLPSRGPILLDGLVSLWQGPSSL